MNGITFRPPSMPASISLGSIRSHSPESIRNCSMCRDGTISCSPRIFRPMPWHGECYIQDPSTILACDLLDPQPGENILDACAAPGGKTAYLAQLHGKPGENRRGGPRPATTRDPARKHCTIERDDCLRPPARLALRSRSRGDQGGGALRSDSGRCPLHKHRGDAPPGGCAMAIAARRL